MRARAFIPLRDGAIPCRISWRGTLTPDRDGVPVYVRRTRSEMRRSRVWWETPDGRTSLEFDAIEDALHWLRAGWVQVEHR